jgi:hypothetical protein
MRRSSDQPCMSHRTRLPTDSYCLQCFWIGGSRTEIVHTIFFFLMAQPPIVGQDRLIVKALWSHSTTPHSVGLLSTNVWPNAHNTQHSQETEIYAPGGIRTYNPSKRTAADRRLRPCGRWQLCTMICQSYLNSRLTHILLFSVWKKLS